MKKDLIVIFLKVIIYAAGLLLAWLGVSTLTSCSVSHQVDAEGRCIIVTSDTTTVNHRGFVYFPKK